MTSLLVEPTNPLRVLTWPADMLTPAGVAMTPCLSHDPESWFAESPCEVEAAKALCGPCPVREQCLQGALERQEPWGVWGGELLLRGAVVARKRPRGRPRKHPLPHQ